MTHDLSIELDSCMELISKAPINDATRVYLTNQSTIYALFLSDLEAGRLRPEQAQAAVVNSMLEMIGEFCSQIRELLGLKAA